MYGYYRQPGPADAFATMLVAYLKKKRMEGALGYVADQKNKMDDMSQAHAEQVPIAPEQYGTNAAQAAGQELIPIKGFGSQVNAQPYDLATRTFQSLTPTASTVPGVGAAQPTDFGINTNLANVASPNSGILSAAEKYANHSANIASPFSAGTTLSASPAQTNAPNANLQDTQAQSVLAQSAENLTQQAQNTPVSAPQATTSAQNPYAGMSTLQMLQDFAAKNDPNNPAVQQAQQNASMSPEQRTAQQQQYNDYAAQEKAHPEWFVGDTYVGTDAKAKAAAQAKQQQIDADRTQVEQQSYNDAFKNPMQEYGYTGKTIAPPSYSQLQSNLTNSKPQMMKDLISKYGIEAAKSVEPMLDAAIKDKLSSYGDTVLDQKRQDIGQLIFGRDENGNLVNNINTPSGLRRLLYNVQDYNITAQKMGKPVYDTSILGKIIESGQTRDIKLDDGGNIHIVTSPKNGGLFDDGQKYHESVVVAKQVSPDKKLQVQEDAWKTQYTQAHEDKRAADRNQTTLQAASMRRSNGGSSGGSNHMQRKWADTLSTKQEAAIGAIKSGAAKNDPNDHSVNDYRKACMDALESGDLDDSDKEAVRKNLNEVYSLYKDSL